MRIAELSDRSGVPIPTIKYYLREGLLPPGELIGRNQARYQERHLHRLRLIRALREVGGLSVAATREVVSVLDSPASGRHEQVGMAHRAVVRRVAADPDDPQWRDARRRAEAWVRELGWRVEPDAPALDQLAGVFLAAARLGDEWLLAHLPRYAEAGLRLAEVEVPPTLALADPAESMAAVAVGTVLGEALLAAVRLLAHEHVSATWRPTPERPAAPDRSATPPAGECAPRNGADADPHPPPVG